MMMEFLTYPVEVPMWVALVIGVNALLRLLGLLWAGMRQDQP